MEVEPLWASIKEIGIDIKISVRRTGLKGTQDTEWVSMSIKGVIRHNTGKKREKKIRACRIRLVETVARHQDEEAREHQEQNKQTFIEGQGEISKQVAASGN